MAHVSCEKSLVVYFLGMSMRWRLQGSKRLIEQIVRADILETLLGLSLDERGGEFHSREATKRDGRGGGGGPLASKSFWRISGCDKCNLKH